MRYLVFLLALSLSLSCNQSPPSGSASVDGQVGSKFSPATSPALFDIWHCLTYSTPRKFQIREDHVWRFEGGREQSNGEWLTAWNGTDSTVIASVKGGREWGKIYLTSSTTLDIVRPCSSCPDSSYTSTFMNDSTYKVLKAHRAPLN